MNINSKTAIVTGVSRGLGKATAEALLRKGARVYGISRSESDLEAMARAWGDLFEPVILDVTKEDKVRSWVSESLSEANPPDILINNAGTGFFEDIDAFSSDQWHQMVNTNLNGVLFHLSYCSLNESYGIQ